MLIRWLTDPGRRSVSSRPGPIRSRMLYEITEGRVRFSADGVPNPETNLSAGACKGLRRVLDKGAALDLQCLKWACSKADEQAAMGLPDQYRTCS
jgi:hypothetical protein